MSRLWYSYLRRRTARDHLVIVVLVVVIVVVDPPLVICPVTAVPTVPLLLNCRVVAV